LNFHRVRGGRSGCPIRADGKAPGHDRIFALSAKGTDLIGRSGDGAIQARTVGLAGGTPERRAATDTGTVGGYDDLNGNWRREIAGVDLIGTGIVGRYRMSDRARIPLRQRRRSLHRARMRTVSNAAVVARTKTGQPVVSVPTSSLVPLDGERGHRDRRDATDPIR